MNSFIILRLGGYGATDLIEAQKFATRLSPPLQLDFFGIFLDFLDFSIFSRIFSKFFGRFWPGKFFLLGSIWDFVKRCFGTKENFDFFLGNFSQLGP